MCVRVCVCWEVCAPLEDIIRPAGYRPTYIKSTDGNLGQEDPQGFEARCFDALAHLVGCTELGWKEAAGA